MKLRLNSPKFVKRMASESISKTVSAELGGDCRIRFTEAEIGMRDKKVYARMSVEGEMDRADFVKFVKMVTQSEGV